MAWLPIEFETPEKGEILDMASALKREPEEVLGRMILVWRWAQEQTTTGVVRPGSLAMVDRQARMKGFGAAMVGVKWLIVDAESVTFPNWDEHNSENAKKRKLDARRAAKSRSKRDANVTDVTDSSRKERDKIATPALTTEQNRTELDGGGGVSPLTPEQTKTVTWLRRRPDWLPEGKPWIDRKACERLARLPLTAVIVEEAYREAKDKRNTLGNPAGYVIKRLEEASGATA